MSEAEFSPVATARRIAREARTAAMATIARRTGHPFGSMVTTALEPDGSPIVLLSTLAAHSRNLAEDTRASLLLVEGTLGDPQQGGRLTLVGRIDRITDDAEQRRRYLTRNPGAGLYAGFADFAFFRLEIEEAHLVAGFGRAMHVRAKDYLLDLAGSEALVAAESTLLARFEETPARAAAWARRIGAPEGDWAAVGVDPEGLDLATRAEAGRAFRRLVLPARASDPATLESLLATWEQ